MHEKLIHAMNSEPERRALILEAAGKLLRHYGPAKTTIADIAREAKVGVGTVYLEFASKEAIVEELSSLRHGAVLHAMQQATRSSRSYRDRFRAMMNARFESFIGCSREGAHAKDLIFCVSPAVRTAQARFREREKNLVADLLREANRAGEFDVDNIDHVAEVLMSAYAIFSPPWVFQLADQTGTDLDTHINTMHDIVLSGLLRRSPRPRKR